MNGAWGHAHDAMGLSSFLDVLWRRAFLQKAWWCPPRRTKAEHFLLPVALHWLIRKPCRPCDVQRRLFAKPLWLAQVLQRQDFLQMFHFACFCRHVRGIP